MDTGSFKSGCIKIAAILNINRQRRSIAHERQEEKALWEKEYLFQKINGQNFPELGTA